MSGNSSELQDEDLGNPIGQEGRNQRLRERAARRSERFDAGDFRVERTFQGRRVAATDDARRQELKEQVAAEAGDGFSAEDVVVEEGGDGFEARLSEKAKAREVRESVLQQAGGDFTKSDVAIQRTEDGFTGEISREARERELTEDVLEDVGGQFDAEDVEIRETADGLKAQIAESARREAVVEDVLENAPEEATAADVSVSEAPDGDLQAQLSTDFQRQQATQNLLSQLDDPDVTAEDVTVQQTGDGFRAQLTEGARRDEVVQDVLEQAPSGFTADDVAVTTGEDGQLQAQITEDAQREAAVDNLLSQTEAFEREDVTVSQTDQGFEAQISEAARREAVVEETLEGTGGEFFPNEVVVQEQADGSLVGRISEDARREAATEDLLSQVEGDFDASDVTVQPTEDGLRATLTEDARREAATADLLAQIDNPDITADDVTVEETAGGLRAQLDEATQREQIESQILAENQEFVPADITFSEGEGGQLQGEVRQSAIERELREDIASQREGITPEDVAVRETPSGELQGRLETGALEALVREEAAQAAGEGITTEDITVSETESGALQPEISQQALEEQATEQLLGRVGEEFDAGDVRIQENGDGEIRATLADQAVSRELREDVAAETAGVDPSEVAVERTADRFDASLSVAGQADAIFGEIAPDRLAESAAANIMAADAAGLFDRETSVTQDDIDDATGLSGDSEARFTAGETGGPAVAAEAAEAIQEEQTIRVESPAFAGVDIERPAASDESALADIDTETGADVTMTETAAPAERSEGPDATLGAQAAAASFYEDLTAATQPFADAADTINEEVTEPVADVVGDTFALAQRGIELGRPTPLSGPSGNTNVEEIEQEFQDLQRGAEAEVGEETAFESAAQGFTEGTGFIVEEAVRSPRTLQNIGTTIGGGTAFAVNQVAEEGVIEGGAESAAAGANFGATVAAQTAQSAQENPAQFVGSLAASAGIIGAANRASSTLGQATATAIQPGEELLSAGLSRAAPSVAARFPNNRIDNEEIVIQGATRAADATAGALRRARSRLEGERALAADLPTSSRARSLVELGGPRGSTGQIEVRDPAEITTSGEVRAESEATQAQASAASAGADPTLPDERPVTLRPEDAPGIETSGETTTTEGVEAETEAASGVDGDLPLREEIRASGGVTQFLQGGEAPSRTIRPEQVPDSLRQFVDDDAARAQLTRARSRGRAEASESASDPEVGFRDFSEVQSEFRQQRRQAGGDFEGTTDPVGRAESRAQAPTGVESVAESPGAVTVDARAEVADLQQEATQPTVDDAAPTPAPPVYAALPSVDVADGTAATGATGRLEAAQQPAVADLTAELSARGGQAERVFEPEMEEVRALAETAQRPAVETGETGLERQRGDVLAEQRTGIEPATRTGTATGARAALETEQAAAARSRSALETEAATDQQQRAEFGFESEQEAEQEFEFETETETEGRRDRFGLDFDSEDGQSTSALFGSGADEDITTFLNPLSGDPLSDGRDGTGGPGLDELFGGQP